MPKLTIQIVSYNSVGDLGSCLESLGLSEFEDFDLVIVDNGSTDGSREYLEGLRAESGVRVIFNEANLGFAAAHNQAFGESDSRYVLVMNPDAILTPKYLSRLLDLIDSDSKIGSAQGRILLRDKDGDRTQTIDSLGLKRYFWGQVVDIGQGERDWRQYGERRRIFGVTGALGFYRRSALESVKERSGYFDSDLFMYKEDVDLAFRLNRKGWISVYEPRAVAYHKRGIRRDLPKMQRPVLIRQLSLANGGLVAIKNERWRSALLVAAYFFIYFLRTILFDAEIFIPSLKRIINFSGIMFKKRHEAFNSDS